MAAQCTGMGEKRTRRQQKNETVWEDFGEGGVLASHTGGFCAGLRGRVARTKFEFSDGKIFYPEFFTENSVDGSEVQN